MQSQCYWILILHAVAAVTVGYVPGIAMSGQAIMYSIVAIYGEYFLSQAPSVTLQANEIEKSVPG